MVTLKPDYWNLRVKLGGRNSPSIQSNSRSINLCSIQVCIFGIHRIQGKQRSAVRTVHPVCDGHRRNERSGCTYMGRSKEVLIFSLSVSIFLCLGYFKFTSYFYLHFHFVFRFAQKSYKSVTHLPVSRSERKILVCFFAKIFANNFAKWWYIWLFLKV